MPNDKLTPYGWLTLKHLNANGEVVEERTIKNLIVNVGMFYTAALLSGSTTVKIGYMAIGTGTTAAAATNTSLQTLITSPGPGATTNSLVTTTVTDDTFQAVTTFTFTTSYAVTEAGLFTTAATGNFTTAPPTYGSSTMLSHQVFAAINVANGDSLQITWKVQAS